MGERVLNSNRIVAKYLFLLVSPTLSSPKLKAPVMLPRMLDLGVLQQSHYRFNIDEW